MRPGVRSFVWWFVVVLATLGRTCWSRHVGENKRDFSGNFPQFDASTVCGMNVSGVIVIPAVRKGLNNQRMRMVQDIVIGALIGAAVELPRIVRTRRDCGYRSDCYRNYDGSVAFSDVFDEVRVINELQATGICIVRTGFREEIPEIMGALWPMPASTFANDFQKQWNTHGVAFSLGGEEDCCTKLVPNTPQSVNLIMRVNAVFATAARIENFALDAERKFHEVTKGAPLVAFHWRGNEDFVKSMHSLNERAHAKAACEALVSALEDIRDQKSGSDALRHIFVLGDVNAAKLRILEAEISSACSGDFTFHTKSSLGSEYIENLAHGPRGGDDIKGQMDFELGTRADAFIGAPFSSFSVLIALERKARFLHSPEMRKFGDNLYTRMINIDVADNLGSIFALNFPYDETMPSRKVCSDLVKLHPPFETALASCIVMENGTYGRRIILRKFNSCTQCKPLIPNICKHTTSMAQLEVRLAHEWSKRDERVRIDDLGVSCERAKEILATFGGPWRQSRTGEIFIYEEEARFILPSFHSALHAALQKKTPHSTARPAHSFCSRTVEDLAANVKISFDLPLDSPVYNGLRVCTLTVITALYGSVDSLEPLQIAVKKHRELLSYERMLGISSCWFAFVDAVAFTYLADATGATDEKRILGRLTYGPYQVVRMPDSLLPFGSGANAPNSRVPKMLPNLFLRFSRYLLYMDAKLHVPSFQNIWVHLYQDLVQHRVLWTSPKHPSRLTPYEEARCIHILGLAPDIVLEHMRSYLDEGLPSDAPLIEGEWHMRDLLDERSSSIGCAWFTEYAKWRHTRDQISFPISTLKLLDNQNLSEYGVIHIVDYNPWWYYQKPRQYKHTGYRLHSNLCHIKPSVDSRAIVMNYITLGPPQNAKIGRERAVAFVPSESFEFITVVKCLATICGSLILIQRRFKRRMKLRNSRLFSG